jgi:hypothetical protein
MWLCFILARLGERLYHAYYTQALSMHEARES